MDDRRFPPHQDPSHGQWSFDDFFAPNPEPPQYAQSSSRHRSRSLSTTRHPIHYPPADAMPNTSQLDLLAALAQNPALASPLQTGREVDFNHALLDALRILTANANAAQAASMHSPQSQQQPYLLPGQPSLPPLQIPPHATHGPAQAGPSTAPPPLDPLIYWLQQNAQAQAAEQSRASGSGASSSRAPQAGPSNAPEASGSQPATRGRARSSATRRVSASAPTSPHRDAGPANTFEAAAQTQLPAAPPIDPEDPAVIEEDKRRRNTAASARFRAKKKQQIHNLERTISDLSSRADELEREASDLRRENGWLKEIVMLKGRALSGQAINPPESSRDGGRYPDAPQ